LLCSALPASAGVYLEPNRGQAKTDAAYLARTPAGTVAAGARAMAYLDRGGSQAAIVFEGASAQASAVPEQLLPGVSHYAQGRDPSGWLWDVPHYGAVRYRGVYSGIDLVYHASQGELEFDFLLAPGADPTRIRMRAPAGVSIDASGSLRLGAAQFHAPSAWQMREGRRAPVSVRFAFDRRRRARFELGPWDPRLPLTIDPVIQFVTYLGGSGNDVGVSVLSGADGAVYVAGNTTSADFPASLPAGSPLVRPDVLLLSTGFVSRLRPDASAFDWSLFVGGTSGQTVYSMKQDAFGNLILLGGTSSPNFPVTASAWHTAIDPSMTDYFLVKLDSLTGHIKASTFLGVTAGDLSRGAQMAIDVAGGIYVGGYRLSGGNFTSTPGAFQKSNTATAFVLRLNSGMSGAVYATSWDLGSIKAMDVDSGGNLVLGGVSALGSGFPAVNPLSGVNQSPNWPEVGYVARLNPTGTAATFASLLDGDGRGSAITDIKIAPDGSLYVVGETSGPDFPQVNPIPLDPLPSNYPAQQDSLTSSPFLTRLSGDGKTILQSTLFYGPEYSGQNIAIYSSITSPRLMFQGNGSPCLAGMDVQVSQQTAGGVVGTPVNDYSAPYVGWSLSCLDPTGTTFNLKTSLPWTNGSGYADLTATSDGAVLFTGSANNVLTTTPGVVQPKFGGTPVLTDYYGELNTIAAGDAFLIRVGLSNPAPSIQDLSPDTQLLDTAINGSLTETLTGSGFVYGATVTVGGQPATYSFIDSGHATISFDASALQPGDNHVVLTVPAPGGGTADRILAGVNTAPYTISVSPASVTQGAAETKLVIRAENLTAGSVLYWNGTARAASFVLDGAQVHSGHFELLLEPAELAQTMSAQVTVSNPGPGGGVSPTALFTVQPASGTAIPLLASPYALLFGGYTALGPAITLTGTGFAAGTQVFWDGASVPVTAYNSGSITIQPPAGDLARLGAHTVYAANGALQSLPVQIPIGRSVSLTDSAYDPNQKRLYALSASATTLYASDLHVFDGVTGNLLATVPGIVSNLLETAISADGQYLYLAGSQENQRPVIVRYNTAAGAVDLQWTPTLAGGTPIYVNSLATPPDSPGTVIVSTSYGQVLIFDGDQPRPFDSIAAGFPVNSGYMARFASGTRIYTAGGAGSLVVPGFCWTWLDYDAFGISGGQPSCAAEPPETQHVSGVTYLTDGTRVYVVSTQPAMSSNSHYTPSYAADLALGQAWEFGQLIYSGENQLFEYNMGTEQLQLKLSFSAEGNGKLYSAGNGAVLMALPNAILLIP
jgi:hypothetical protein